MEEDSLLSRVSLHVRDDMWGSGLGAWPCSDVLGERLPDTVTLPRHQCQTMRCFGKLPMHHPISKLGQCWNRREAEHWGPGWCLFINSESRRKRGLAALLPESSPVLTGKGWPEPFQSHSYLKGKTLEGCQTCDSSCNGASPRGNVYGFMAQLHTKLPPRAA